MGIYDERTNLKPFEYPELIRYMKAIQQSYWVVDEFNLTQDVQDFYLTSEVEKSAIKHSLLAIAQVEVSVKSFWGDIYKHFPKPEIAMVGYTFANNEVIHSESYSHLLEILGLNREFERIFEIPAINDRVNYLKKALSGTKSRSKEEYILSLILFSIFIENVSLFSQFLIILSFNKYKNIFRGVSNIIQATSADENIHGEFGMAVVNILREEMPEVFTEDFKLRVQESCRKALKAENKVLDWIFEEGELEFLPKETIVNFIKNRYNNSLKSVGIEPVWEVDLGLLSDVQWFEEETTATSQVDFFAKRPTSYTKFTQSITEDDLF